MSRLPECGRLLSQAVNTRFSRDHQKIIMTTDESSQVRVYIVDDDASSRQTMTDLLAGLEIVVETFASAEEFLEEYTPERPGCLLLDISMPGLSGPELQQEMNARGWLIPIVLVSGQADVPVTVQTMEAGAVAVLEKPIDGQELVMRVHQALELDWERRTAQNRLAEITSRYESLTPRERQVLEMVVFGLISKQIGIKLGASERTIDVHRSRIMKKMQVRTVAELSAVCVANGLVGTKPTKE